jgi:hypothetical protein
MTTSADHSDNRNQIESVLRAANRNPYEHSANIERQVWYRNARFRAWASRLPLEARWSHEVNCVSLQLSCVTCQRRSQQRSDLAALLLVKAPEKIFVFAEKKALRILREMHRCDHLEPLNQPDPEELSCLVELELLVGP